MNYINLFYLRLLYWHLVYNIYFSIYLSNTYLFAHHSTSRLWDMFLSKTRTFLVKLLKFIALIVFKMWVKYSQWSNSYRIYRWLLSHTSEYGQDLHTLILEPNSCFHHVITNWVYAIFIIPRFIKDMCHSIHSLCVEKHDFLIILFHILDDL